MIRMTSEIRFPALYAIADRASARQQALYFSLIFGEYASLIAVAVMSVNMIQARWYIVVYGVFLIIALGILITRTLLKPEQKWYQARALAESVKTTTWKFAMGARPFEHDANDRQRLRQILGDLLTANRQLGPQFDSNINIRDQIPSEADAIRNLSRSERLDLYMRDRVDNQLDWYTQKAASNARTGLMFAVALGILYFAAFIIFCMRMERPDWIYMHPDPILLLAASVLGWMQIKRFNELGTSYNLTAIEISILISRAPEIQDDESLSLFIDDAEEAFSREHTQWLARRSILTNN